jgi:quercetin dioxygenase-like cupin family protein
MNKLMVAGLALLAGMAGTSPAFAGTCPADQVGTNALADAATKPKGVTDTVIGSVNLGPEINVTGRSLRTRMLVVQPGGVVPLHSHVDRPALIMVSSGTMAEYRSSCLVPITHNAGEVASESGGISHWWKNIGDTVAVLYSSDVHNDTKP